MSTQRFFTRWRGLLGGLMALILLIISPGCDTAGSGEETLVLADPLTPTVSTFEFEYDESHFEDGVITVTSNEEDQLSSVLEAYGGYDRSDVVSVRVEEVRLERLSLPETAAKQVPKVFEYLTRAEVYMGTSTGAPRIGTAEPVPFNAEITLDLGPDRDVTSQVQSGPTRMLLQLSIEDASEIGSGGDRVEMEVEFRVEVQE